MGDLESSDVFGAFNKKRVCIEPRFSTVFYRKENPYFFTDDAARAHFETRGIAQGLPGSPACYQGFFVGMIQRLNPGLVLEVGPGASPKLRGENIRYFDVKSKAELQYRYRSSDTENIPECIHYTDPSGDLGVISEKFDVIFSSHMIEHSLDLVDHLNMVADKLNPGGLYFIVAPNKNYTFDYFKPVSQIEDVIAHHEICRGSPTLSLRALLLEVNRRTHNDPARHWSGDHGGWSYDEKGTSQAIKDYKAISEDPLTRSGYHSWFFDDRSFSELVTGLRELGYIRLELGCVYNTIRGSCSFNAVLRKSP